MTTTAGVNALTADEIKSLECLDLSTAWFLALTRPRHEIVAEQNLRQQNFDVYMPVYKTIKKTLTGSQVLFEPMFARYIFFRPTSVKQSLDLVRSSRGIANIVSFGHKPASISQDALTQIRLYERTRNTTDIENLQPLRSSVEMTPLDPAFANIKGLVQTVSKHRVSVLLEILGRSNVLVAEPSETELLV